MSNKTLSASKLAPWNWFRHENETPSRLVTRNDYEQPMAHFHQEVDRLFDDAFRSFGMPSLLSRRDESLNDSGLMLRPKVDIHEQDDAYRISVEVPGVSEDDLKLTLEGDNLIISGEKSHENTEQEKGRVHRVERSYGSFQRILNLPVDVNAHDIKADFKNGVLTVTLPRDESKLPDQGRTIPIGKA